MDVFNFASENLFTGNFLLTNGPADFLMIVDFVVRCGEVKYLLARDVARLVLIHTFACYC